MQLRQRVSELRDLRRPGYALAAIPFGLILGITVADVLIPGRVHLAPLLVAAPAITAALAGPRLTGTVGLLAVADQMLIGARDGELGSQELRVQVLALMVVTALVVGFSLLRDRDRRELVQVRSVSEAAQRVLLRPLPELIGPLRLASVYLAAEEEAQIGGDLYGAARTTGGTRLIIGDARGKGLEAISEAALLLGAFREASRRHTSLPMLIADLEESVSAGPGQPVEAGHDADESFVTAAVFEIPDDDALLDMISCGHPPPLMMRGGRVTTLHAGRPAPPLGLGVLHEPDYDIETFKFEAGDILLLYTDGVIEARDPGGVFYPLAERVSGWTGDSPEALLRHIHDDLLAHVGGHLGDDAAMIAIERLAGRDGPAACDS
ncbi:MULTISPECIES: PP2C family protein-serine/threonine phosphatase [Streptosporangium]|uniref:Serine phosphatase RsbU (Regulator of sigma subunit) n=1 Tax=Streptosporangium brasiliense TaxID=47480 RepID=A0ABT9RCA2_9ACTN|nr:PP2C family protein-serine/threonine phosphatase [Streptosporangium brasiliense]MDP9866496.1 serine phosphatase RsbU (regulator of sigma subunit) [Streptosporangium brasiliense]